MRSLGPLASSLVGLVSLTLSCAPAPLLPPPPVAPATAPSSPPSAAATTGGSTPALPTPVGSHGDPPDDELRKTAPGSITTIADLLRSRPKAGRFTLTGYTQRGYHCAPCTPAGACSPCADLIWVSDSFGAGIKQPLTADLDLLVHVPDASRFGFRGRYRLTVDVGPREDPQTGRRELHLRGYTPVAPGE